MQANSVPTTSLTAQDAAQMASLDALIIEMEQYLGNLDGIGNDQTAPATNPN